MSDLQIKYVSKGTETHEGITRVGSDDWSATTAEVIQAVGHTDAIKRNTYYTKDSAGVRSEVKVVNGKNGQYLRTHKNGIENDNLLSLPDFPRFATGQKCKVAGVYVFDGYVDGSVSPAPASGERQVTLSVGVPFIPIMSSMKAAYWKLQRAT